VVAKRRPDHVLLDRITIAQARAALDDVSRGAGGELKVAKRGSPPFCSPDSSAALAVNSFAPFIDHAFRDRQLGISVARPSFERTFRITGVRSRVPPTLDVVLQEKRRAVLIESKLLEPWRSAPKVTFSPQYDAVAEQISAGVAQTMSALRAGELTYEALDAAQLIKHLFGIQSAIRKGNLPGRCTLVLLYWEPTRSGSYATLFSLLRDEVADLAERLSDQQVPLRSLSYPQLWQAWRRHGVPAWLRSHAEALQRRYGVAL
jgi:hypothetical protein